MKQHKWHKEIKAWADGAEIEQRFFDEDIQDWSQWKTWAKSGDVTVNFIVNDCFEYRIKPQPKEPQYLYVYELGGEYRLHEYKTDFMPFVFGEKMRNMAYTKTKIKLEQDDE